MSTPTRLYTRILVPIDGSSAAEFAIRFARDLASKHQAELILLYLNTVTPPPDNAQQSPAEDRQMYLDRLRKEYHTDDVTLRTEIVVSHNLREALFKFIDTERVSAVVLSTRGRTSMLRWLFGSAIESTLDGFPVPLMLVRPIYQKIVVPMDGSKWSESAIPRAVEIARLHDAELLLLHVYQPKGGDYAAEWALAGQQQIADQSIEQMREQLVALRNLLRQEGLRAGEVLIQGSNPAQAICDFVASEDGIILIVMSTHGRTGLSRWLMGSVAQNVIKNSRSPVMLVHIDQ